MAYSGAFPGEKSGQPFGLARFRLGSLQARPSRDVLSTLSRFCLLALTFAVLSCARDSRPGPGGAAREPASVVGGDGSSGLSFVDVTTSAGLELRHRTASEGTWPMPAIMGGGLCVFDADGDGWVDVLAVGGRPGAGWGNRLFRQVEPMRFEDASVAAGLAVSPGDDERWGQGCALGDVDNDGDLDVFISAWGGDELLRNEGGRFAQRQGDVLARDGWSASATFVDLDRDGWLDLYVTRYVDYRIGRECFLEGGRPDYCGPAQLAALPDRVYRNLDGRGFEDMSGPWGVQRLRYRGLGVDLLPVADSGPPALYVANDSDPNLLWVWRDGRLEDEAILEGLAFNRYGVGEAGMGVAVGDADGDGDFDLMVTHLADETNTLYGNRGAVGFEDISAEAGVGLPSLGVTGFGTVFFDGDLDGDLDVAIANGAVKRRSEPQEGASPGFWNAYGERNSLLTSSAGGYVEAAEGEGDFFASAEVSRGLVPADLDRDGDLDLVLSNVEGPVRIYRNDSKGSDGSRGSFLSVRAVLPERGGRDALGATIALFAGERRFIGVVSSGGSYLSGREPVVHFGLGQLTAIDRIEVRWPDGMAESFPGGEVSKARRLERGTGVSVR